MKSFQVLTAVILLIFYSAAFAADDQQELESLLHEFMAGASANSEQAHDRFWSEELVYTSSGGERFGKSDIMKGFDTEAEPEEDEVPTVYTAEEVLIRVYGETAVITFRLVGTTQEAPPVVSGYFNTGTFLREEGEWRAVAWQATKIPMAR